LVRAACWLVAVLLGLVAVIDFLLARAAKRPLLRRPLQGRRTLARDTVALEECELYIDPCR
jgi:hypothetical protein